jgi:hypothetical protein
MTMPLDVPVPPFAWAAVLTLLAAVVAVDLLLTRRPAAADRAAGRLPGPARAAGRAGSLRRGGAGGPAPTPAPARPVTSLPEGWVAAAIPDNLDAVEVARTARGLALEQDRPLLLLVPQPGTGFTIDPTVHVLAQRRREEAAAAVVGRVLPVIEAPGARVREVRVQVVAHGSGTLRRRHRDAGLRPGPALVALLTAARRAGAGVLVVPASMLPERRHDGRPVLLDVEARRVIPAAPAPAGTTVGAGDQQEPAPAR